MPLTMRRWSLAGWPACGYYDGTTSEWNSRKRPRANLSWEVKGCLPLGVLALGYQPEMETPATLNGWRPREAVEDVPACFTLYPQPPATSSPQPTERPPRANLRAKNQPRASLHARTVQTFALITC